MSKRKSPLEDFPHLNTVASSTPLSLHPPNTSSLEQPTPRPSLTSLKTLASSHPSTPNNSLPPLYPSLVNSSLSRRPMPSPSISNLTASTPKKFSRSISSSKAILVNSCQKGNPLFKHLTMVAFEYADIIPDFMVGSLACAFYLSIQYRRLFPDYIHKRVQELGPKTFASRLLLLHVDADDHQQSIREMTRFCVQQNMTLIVSWSSEECARYLETFKLLENKPADMIKDRNDGSPNARLIEFLTCIRGINKTDVQTLIVTFGTLAQIMNASIHQLSRCPGFGDQKARKIHHVFRQAFQS